MQMARQNDEYINVYSDKCWVSINKGPLAERIFIMTNAAMYLLSKFTGSECEICPREIYCKGGPKLENVIKLKEIVDQEYLKESKTINEFALSLCK